MVSAAGIADDQASGKASNFVNSSSSAACDVSGQQESSSGAALGGKYVGIDILGKALQIAVDSDSVAGRCVSNGMPKAVNLDTLVKTICELQEAVPSSPGDTRTEAAQSQVPAEQISGNTDAAKHEQEKSSAQQLRPHRCRPSTGSVQTIVLPNRPTRELSQSPQSSHRKLQAAMPAIDWVLAKPLAKLAPAGQDQGPTNSGVNNSTSPHSSRGTPAHQELEHHMSSNPPTPTSNSTAAKPLMRSSSRRGPSSKTSPYRGVSCYKRTGRWEAHIWHAGRQVHLGTYSTSQEAARVYDTAAIKLRGWSADLNFDVEDYRDDPTLKDAPIELDKHSAGQSVAEMVKSLKRRSKGCGIRGGRKGKQSLGTLDASNNGSRDVAAPIGGQSCWAQQVASGSTINLNQVCGESTSEQLQASILSSSRSDISQRLGRLALCTNAAGRHLSSMADSPVYGPQVQYIFRGGIDSGDQHVPSDPGGRVIVRGPDGNLFVASLESNAGLLSSRSVGDSNGTACLGYIVQGCVDQAACGLQGGDAVQMPLLQMLSNGRNASMDHPSQGILSDAQTGVMWRGNVLLGLPPSSQCVVQQGRLTGGSTGPCETVLEGKPVRRQTSNSQPGIAAHWPKLRDEQAPVAGLTMEHSVGRQVLHSPGIRSPQGRPTNHAAQPIRCIEHPCEQKQPMVTQALPHGQNRLLYTTDLSQGVVTRGSVIQQNAAECVSSDGSTSRIARLMEIINELPANSKVKSNSSIAETKQEVRGHARRGTMEPHLSALRGEMEATPSFLSHGWPQREDSGSALGSVRSGGRTPGGAPADSVTPRLYNEASLVKPCQPADSKGAAASVRLVPSKVTTAPVANAEAVMPHLDGEGAHLQTAVLVQDLNKAPNFTMSGSSLHNTEHDRREGSQGHREDEETDEDLLAAQQLCALATAECGTLIIADDPSEHSNNHLNVDTRGDALPMWQVKKPRTSSYRSIRQDFEILESVLRQSDMKSVRDERFVQDAVFHAQGSTKIANGRQGAPSTVGTRSVSAFKRRRCDGSMVHQQPGDRGVVDVQMVDRWNGRDSASRAADSLCPGGNDGHRGRKADNHTYTTAVADAEMSIDGTGSSASLRNEALKNDKEGKGTAADSQGRSSHVPSRRLGVMGI